MEAFSLLKYWRAAGGAPPEPLSANSRSPDATTTIVTAVAQNALETNDNDDDDGPFFDLEFTVPDEADDSEDGHENLNGNHSDDDDDGDGEREFNFTLSSSTNDPSDPNLPLSPSDDMFFKGKLVQVEPPSFVINSSEPNSKPQFRASLLKSATKLRVFMSSLKKSKSNASDRESNRFDAPKQAQSEQSESLKKPLERQAQQRKLFRVKFKVEQVPIMSLFTRDSSAKGDSANKSQKQNTEELPCSASDEKHFSKEVMQRYLRVLKPLYIRVSKRHGGKLRFSGQLNVGSRVKAGPVKLGGVKTQTEADACEAQEANLMGNLPAGLKVGCKHLGKSRSASSAGVSVSSKRRDDSLVQQQDGIQGAILHCKRSFNASRESVSSQLPRSVSDPLQEISPGFSRNY